MNRNGLFLAIMLRRVLGCVLIGILINLNACTCPVVSGRVDAQKIGAHDGPLSSLGNAESVETDEEASQSLLDLLQQLDKAQKDSRIRFIKRNGANEVTYIFLAHSNCTNKNIGLLTRLTELGEVRLRCPARNEPISIEAINALTRLKKLRRLQIDYAAPRFSVDYGKAISKMRELSEVKLTGMLLSRDALAPLTALPKLRSLEIEVPNEFDGIQSMERVATLKQLTVISTEITGVAWKDITNSPSLEHLHIPAKQVENAKLQEIQSAGKIKIHPIK